MIEKVHNYLPSDWSYMICGGSDDYELVDLSEYSSEYESLKSRIDDEDFCLDVKSIQRVQNPYVYGQFLLRKEEYETRGDVKVVELYHDTGASKIQSIVRSNLDRRYVRRDKYGKGVSFSPDPSYANRESSRNNGSDRAMIIADVLIQNEEIVCNSVVLPSSGYDTTVANCDQVYVKYYDDEFYPKYVVYYDNTPRYRRFYF